MIEPRVDLLRAAALAAIIASGLSGPPAVSGGDPAPVAPAAESHPAVPPAPPSTAPGGIAWEALKPHLKAALFVVREGPHRWGITALPGDPPAGEAEGRLRAVAVEALTAAHDDLAWIAGEVFNHRLFVSQPMMPGDTLKPREEYLNALIENASFANPLRRFTDALLRSKGTSCADCLEHLPPSRDVTWSEVRPYIEDFIHVSDAGGEGRVDLHIATAENRVPEFHLSHHDLAAAVYAAMQGAIKASPEFMQAVQSDLNDELLQMREGEPGSTRSALNQNLPARIIKDPRCLAPILAHLPEALERHSLHCIDCPRAR